MVRGMRVKLALAAALVTGTALVGCRREAGSWAWIASSRPRRRSRARRVWSATMATAAVDCPADADKPAPKQSRKL